MCRRESLTTTFTAARQCGVADALRDLPELATLYADLSQQLIDQWCLRTETQCAVDDAVGQPCTHVAVGVTVSAATEPVHVQDLDAFDALHRLDALANDAF